MTNESAEGDADQPFIPEWDQKIAETAIGKTILIGVTYMAADGVTIMGQVQYHGIVVAVDTSIGVNVECRGEHVGKTLNLPPDLKVFAPAEPGHYRLRSSGEVVIDPDFATQWKMVEGVKH
jgi:hypothetical protein